MYEGEEITITVPARYAELVRTDDIGSDNIFVVEPTSTTSGLYGGRHAPDLRRLDADGGIPVP